MLQSSPKVSVVIPIHNMQNGDFFLWRSIQALMKQTFQDFEIVITQEGKMAKNTNAGITRARGEIIKILYLDDYLAHPNALQKIVDKFGESQWLVTGCLHQATETGEKGFYVDDYLSNFYEDPHSPHYPEYTDDIHTGNNRIGSPSVLAFRNEGHLLFDEEMSWLLDCDLYKRYYATYGAPTILKDLNVVIGIGPHQTTHNLSDHEKQAEFNYLNKKYG